MELQNKQETKSIWEQKLDEHRKGKLVFGIIIVLIGIAFLMQKIGYIFPFWFFSWKVLLIAIGLGIGFKHSFRNAGWLAPFLVGTIFLIADLYPALALKPLLWPIAIIVVGLFIIFKPRSREWKNHHYYRHHRKWHQEYASYKNAEDADNPDFSKNDTGMRNRNEDYLEATSIMGGISRKVISKNFKGGDITTIMGSTEINLLQADFEGSISLSVTQVMGGTKLIVPAHWTIRSEFTSVIASIEDNRPSQTTTPTNPDKVLLLEGTSVMGGIEISSYS